MRSSAAFCLGVVVKGVSPAPTRRILNPRESPRRGKTRQTTRNQRSDTIRRRRRDVAPIIGLEPPPAKPHFPKKSRRRIRQLTDTSALPRSAAFCLGVVSKGVSHGVKCVCAGRRATTLGKGGQVPSFGRPRFRIVFSSPNFPTAFDTHGSEPYGRLFFIA